MDCLFSLKKEENPVTCYDMDKPRRHYAIIQSGISLAGKDKCCRFHSRGTSSSPTQGDRMWNGVSRAGRSESCLMGREFQFCKVRMCRHRLHSRVSIVHTQNSSLRNGSGGTFYVILLITVLKKVLECYTPSLFPVVGKLQDLVRQYEIKSERVIGEAQ